MFSSVSFQPLLGIVIFTSIEVVAIGYLALFFTRRLQQHGRFSNLKSVPLWLRELWSSFIREHAQLEHHSAQRTAQHTNQLDIVSVSIIVLASVLLAVVEYYGSSTQYTLLAGPLSLFTDQPEQLLNDTFNTGERAELYRLAYWALFSSVCFFVIPATFAKAILKVPLRDLGFQCSNIFKHLWIYVALYATVLPFVVLVSFEPSFRRQYPFYENAWLSWKDLLAWELLYATQFIALEFFFRGFLIHGLKQRFGFYAIMVSCIPYVMIHYGKPFPETIGAIFAGIALGILSIYSRSIILGILIHISIALSMDILSLLGQSKL